MNAYILGSDLEIVGVIDDYYSFIWTERYWEFGDFELELPMDYVYSEWLVKGNYVLKPGSVTVMVIDTIKKHTTPDKDTILVSGESVESLLKRRWTDRVIDAKGDAEEFMYYLVLSEFVNPLDSDRDMTILGATTQLNLFNEPFQSQFEIQSVYDIIVTICKLTGLGFRIIRTSSDPRELKFLVQQGTNRSLWASTVTPVVFAESFDNVISASYYSTHRDRITLVRVITDDLVYPFVDVYDEENLGEFASEPTELSRYEKTIEVTINRELDDENPLTDAEVLAIIKSKGLEVIRSNNKIGMFDGDYDVDGAFKLNDDFYLGDLIHVAFEGHNQAARVVEVVYSYTTEGIKTYMGLDYVNVGVFNLPGEL